MSTSQIQNNKPVNYQKLEFFYKEYIRLDQYRQDYIKSSFEDFKLLASIGTFGTLILSVLASKPVASFFNSSCPTFKLGSPSLLFSKLGYPSLLFVGFLILFFLVAILAFRDRLKGAIINYYTENLKVYEEAIRKEINVIDSISEPQQHIFNFNRKINSNFEPGYKKVFQAFAKMFLLAIILIPTIVLCFVEPFLAFLYFVITSGIGLWYLRTS